MALLLAVTMAVLAYANAGMMMNMMGMQQGMQQQQQQYMMPMGNGGCQNAQPDHNGQMPAGCEIPMGGQDNMQEYLEQQMEAQQYETQQMAEKIKAQFEEMVRDVEVKKHRYVMSLVGEFVSFCYCAASSQAVQAQYFETAKALNLTDGVELWDSNRLPYQATSEEDARGLIFSGLVKGMCEAATSFNTFAEQVQARIPVFQNQGKK